VTCCAAGGPPSAARDAQGARSPDVTSAGWSCAWPGRTPPGDIGESTASSLASASGSHLRRCGRFFTVDLLNGAKVYCLAVIEHASRWIHVLGATANPSASWVIQQARNLILDLDGHAETIKFLVRDRDAKFVAAFDAVFQCTGIRVIKTPVQAPRANAIMERWIGSCRREILDRTLVWNLPHLRRVLAEYEDHYNRHRPHRALHQASPLKELPEPADLDQLAVRRRDRLGGILHEYAQVA
jgi:putative transposase